jgi:hypothetical protein
MVVDNIDNVREHMDFQDSNDVYLIVIMRRKKDFCKGTWPSVRSNQAQRVLKTYFIRSVKDFDDHVNEIKELCILLNARAYFYPQVRDISSCMVALNRQTLDNITQPQAQPNSMLLRSFAAEKSSRARRWLIDIDSVDGIITEDDKEAVLKYFTSGEHNIGNGYWSNRSVTGLHIITERFDKRNIFDEWKLTFPHLTAEIKPDNATLLYYSDFFKNAHKWVMLAAMNSKETN